MLNPQREAFLSTFSLDVLLPIFGETLCKADILTAHPSVPSLGSKGVTAGLTTALVRVQRESFCTEEGGVRSPSCATALEGPEICLRAARLAQGSPAWQASHLPSFLSKPGSSIPQL